jgi:phosphoadenosine phosphosulfate reductase
MSATAVQRDARLTAGHEERLAQALGVLTRAAQDHPGSIVQATSLGAEDMVITDLIARHRLPITLATLDTGALHEPTLALLDRLQSHYRVSVEVYRPREQAVIQFVREHGEQAMYQSQALRKACCSLRKLEPLARMMNGRTAWVTGLRREQSDARGEVAAVQPDGQGRFKVSPLVEWSWADVWHYIATHEVPYNPLHDEFMPSIGCAPCTRAIAVGEPFRAGRWWWETESAKECGLHA